MLNVEKLSISLPISMVKFMENYRESHACKSKSEVIQQALKLLQERELELCYREANAEIDPLFDITTGDGIEDEAW